jgi:hypothetical protein
VSPPAGMEQVLVSSSANGRAGTALAGVPVTSLLAAVLANASEI